MTELKKSALITGASSGIGRETALAFASSGIEVALIGRSAEKLAAVENTVTKTGVKAKTYVVDLAKVSDVKENIHQIVLDFGNIDILVNNAGMGYTGTLSETPLSDWQQVIDLNLTSVFECIKGILPSMRQQNRGTIINVASIAGKQAFANWGAYSVSKAGVIALSQALAQEERANGIRVTAICSGAVNTEIWDTETVNADFDRSNMLTPQIVAQSILHAALLPKQAVVDELTLMPSAGVL